MTDEQCMQQAIEVASRGIEGGQTPFGTSLVRDGETIAVTHNSVWDRCDPTAHAEVLAIRQVCKTLGDIDLSGCVIYSTCEPCPMCFAAIHWARISKVFFGANIEDAAAIGFNELHISNEQIRTLGHSPVEVVGGFMREPCLARFQEWVDREDRRVY